jgi:DNA polymerase-3 subunit delta
LRQKKQTNAYESIRREVRSGEVCFAYIFSGEENYLKEAALKELCSLISDEMEEFNLFFFDGASFEPEDLLSAVETVPVFSERKLIVLRDFSLPPAQKYAAVFERIFESPPDYSVLVFLYLGLEFSPPKASSRPEWFEKIKLLNFSRPEQSALCNWVIRRLKAGGKSCSKQLAEYLCFVNGGTMEDLVCEIEKLTAHRPGEPVTREDIDLVITRSLDTDIYKITDAICSKNPREALRLCCALLENRTPPAAILNSLGRAARQMYGAKLINESKRSTRDLMELFGLRFSFIAENLLRNSRGFSREGLALWIKLCLEADLSMKTTKQDDALIIERLITQLAMVK